MLLVAPVRDVQIDGDGLDRLDGIQGKIPAVTHVDGTARIQTVSADTNPRYHRLLNSFEDLTGCPVLVNTSFNVRGEPIVCTPDEAYTCFRRTHMDVLVLGNHLISKDMIPGAEDSILTAVEIASQYGLD